MTDVDCVSGVDLGTQLVTDRRFAAGVRQQRGVDQGRERRLDRFGGTVGQAPQDRGEHARGSSGRSASVSIDVLRCATTSMRLPMSFVPAAARPSSGSDSIARITTVAM